MEKWVIALITVGIFLVIVVALVLFFSFGGSGSSGGQQPCTTNEDCQTGQICLDSVCVTGCTEDTDCASDEICFNGGCVTGCREDGDCIPGQICLNSACIVGCRTTDDCYPGELCRSYVCVAGCQVDGDCGSGQCVNEACTVITTCTTSPPCGADSLCINGTCTPRLTDMGCYQTANVDAPSGYLWLKDANINSEAALEAWFDANQGLISHLGSVAVPVPVYIAVTRPSSSQANYVFMFYSSTLPTTIPPSTTVKDDPSIAPCQITSGTLVTGCKPDSGIPSCSVQTYRIYRYFPSYILGPSAGGPGGSQQGNKFCPSNQHVKQFQNYPYAANTENLAAVAGICTDGSYTDILGNLGNASIIYAETGICSNNLYSGLKVTYDSNGQVHSTQAICTDGSLIKPVAGDPSGSTATLKCTGNQAIVGITGSSGQALDKIQIICGWL